MQAIQVTENRKKFFSKATVAALKTRLEIYSAAKPFLSRANDEDSKYVHIPCFFPGTNATPQRTKIKQS